MEDLGARLRHLRTRAGMSLYEVERRLRQQGSNLHFTSISKYERGERQPSLPVLKELAKVYRVSLAQVVTGTADMEDQLPADLLWALEVMESRPELMRLLETASNLTADQVKALTRLLESLATEGS